MPENREVLAFELNAAIKEAVNKFIKDTVVDESIEEYTTSRLQTIDILVAEISFNIFSLAICCVKPGEELTLFMDTMGKEMIKDIPNIINDQFKTLQDSRREKGKCLPQKP